MEVYTIRCRDPAPDFRIEVEELFSAAETRKAEAGGTFGRRAALVTPGAGPATDTGPAYADRGAFTIRVRPAAPRSATSPYSVTPEDGSTAIGWLQAQQPPDTEELDLDELRSAAASSAIAPPPTADASADGSGALNEGEAPHHAMEQGTAHFVRQRDINPAAATDPLQELVQPQSAAVATAAVVTGAGLGSPTGGRGAASTTTPGTLQRGDSDDAGEYPAYSIPAWSSQDEDAQLHWEQLGLPEPRRDPLPEWARS
jgi:hypothetical protein